jgi:hypothetical protein
MTDKKRFYQSFHASFLGGFRKPPKPNRLLVCPALAINLAVVVKRNVMAKCLQELLKYF